jgi:hypothetical protein
MPAQSTIWNLESRIQNGVNRQVRQERQEERTDGVATKTRKHETKGWEE